MAHQIMGQRFMARSKPAWHNIAKRIFDENETISASDAMKEIAGDIEIKSFPLQYTRPTVLGTTETVETDNRLIVRLPTADDPKYVEMGIASDAWAFDSYPVLAATLNELPNNGYPVETAGLLNDGGLAFLCFRAQGDWSVRGDEMRSYFAANFSMTPGVGHKIFHSPIRVVCWNTNTMADAAATINLSIPHSQDAKVRMALAAKLVTQFSEMKDKSKAIFEAFADRHLTQKDVDAIIWAAFQLPTLPAKLRLLKQQLSDTEAETFKRALTPTMLIDLEKEQDRYDKQCENVLMLRAEAQERFEAFEPRNLRGTAWAAYNAVTEVADWREGRNADEGALFGSRAKEKSRAYEAAMALVAK